MLEVCVLPNFLFLLCFIFFYRHHAQGYLVKTVQSAFPIIVKMNTNVIVFLATQEDTVKQVRDMDETEYLLPISRGIPETPLPWINYCCGATL